MDHPVEVVAFQEELRLALVAREAVDDEAVIPVVLPEPYPDDALHEVVADQQSGRHRAPDLRAEFSVMLDVPPEDVPHCDVLEVEVPGEHFGVSSLAAALDAHDDVFPHAVTFARNRAPGSWPPGYAPLGQRRCPRHRPGGRSAPRHVGPAAVRRGQEDGTAGALAAGQVDRPGGAGASGMVTTWPPFVEMIRCGGRVPGPAARHRRRWPWTLAGRSARV